MKKGSFHTAGWMLTSLFACLVFLSNVSHARSFSIVSKVGTVLPTTIHTDSSATAFYTITNNTAAPRNNNYVKWLPPGAAQVTSNGLYKDTCGSPFSLAGKGQTGDSCTLQLSISSAINSNDPNPQHHLFACFPGGKTCSGTNDPLNVKETNGRAFAYVTDEADSTVNLCLVNPDGLIGTCSNLGNPGGTFNEPTGITLNHTGTMAYVANGIFNTANSVSFCSILADGGFSTCKDSGSIFNVPTSITLNKAGTMAYVTNSASNSTIVSICTIITDGVFGTCVGSGNSGIPFNKPFGIAINNEGTIAYVTNAGSGKVSRCPIKPSGTFGNCEYEALYPGAQPYGIALNSGGTIAYIVDGNNADTVFACPITPTGSFGICINAAASISDSKYFAYGGITLNQAGTVAYLAIGNESKFYTCTITDDGMSFEACTLSFTSSFGVALN